MGKLIDPERSRRARRAREDRARRIYAAARTAFVRFPYPEVTLDTIGQQAGVKQGQASLAFKSREELYLAIIRDELGRWYDDLKAALDASSAELDPDAVARLVASSLDEHTDLTRLLGALHDALELHGDGVEVHLFYAWQRERLLELAAAVAQRAPGVDLWSGFDALYRALLIAGTVDPLSRPVGNLAIDLVTDDHQIFALDLEDEVRRAVRDSLAG
jgi:AcrR family transcriptional regulator